jgi:hypothetical protein
MQVISSGSYIYTDDVVLTFTASTKSLTASVASLTENTASSISYTYDVIYNNETFDYSIGVDELTNVTITIDLT